MHAYAQTAADAFVAECIFEECENHMHKQQQMRLLPSVSSRSVRIAANPSGSTLLHYARYAVPSSASALLSSSTVVLRMRFVSGATTSASASPPSEATYVTRAG